MDGFLNEFLSLSGRSVLFSPVQNVEKFLYRSLLCYPPVQLVQVVEDVL